MIFEYNGNMSYEDRLNKVTNEIQIMYPSIEKEKAKLASVMEQPINDKLNYRNIFSRYYNILFVNMDSKDFQNEVFYDMIEIFRESDDEYINNKMIELEEYFNNNGNFPSIN